MVKQADKYSISFSLSRVRTLGFSYTHIPGVKPETQANFNAEVGIQVRDDLKSLGILSVTSGVLSLEDQRDEFFTHKAEFIFDVQGFRQIAENEGEVRLPHRFLTHVISMVISTLRGILIEKGRDTLLQQFILPPIDVKEMVGKPDERGFAILVNQPQENN